MKNDVIISLGGSIIVPDEVDVDFLKKFRQLIINQSKTKRFFIICGGGRTARKYAGAAKQITELKAEDLDWLGIHSTRLNAHLLRTIFRKYAYPKIVKNPTEKIKTNKKVIIAAGWKPGCSTDYDAVLLAKTHGIKTIINLSNIDYAYDKDPRKFPGAEPILRTDWKTFRSYLPKKWDPGLNSPFDPIASKESQKLKLKVIIANGRNIKNLQNILENKDFKGSTIE
jgi:uridylate kinase